MAYNSIYTRINWENEKNTPLGATNLNKMDVALKELDDRIVALSEQSENFATKDEIPEVEIATTENVGLVKPDGSTTYIDADGTLHAVGGGGGTGGTTDYNDLDNKPSINGITLEGAKTLDDLGITIPSTLDTLEEIETNTTPGKAAGALAVKEVTESLSSLYEQETTHYQEVNEALETHGTAISEISEVVSNGTVNHSKSATKAEQDQYGQNISTTYATNNDLSTEMMNQYRNIMVQVAEQISRLDERIDKTDESVSVATTEKTGTVKPDGSTITVDTDGTIHASGGTGGKGEKGDPGEDGISCTHEWNGTVLTVTSASGTSSADLKGEKGDPTNVATQSADGLMSKEDKKLSDRVFKRLSPNIQIPANADLNTIEYLKIGTYGCVSANNAATLINCPTTNAFTMEVFNPYGGTYDNESTAPWVYRTRKIITGDGTTHYQLVRSGNTPGEFTYGDWNHNYSSNNKPTASDVGADASGSAAQALTDAKAYTDEKVPTKISQLTNDSNFMTSYTETDPTVPAWAKASTKPTYTKDEIGLGNVDNTADSVKNVASATKATQDASGNVITTTYATKAELNNISVPTKISQLENDGKFVELDEYENLNVPERVKANTAEFSDGIYSSGGIYEDNQYGGNAVVKTKDELSALTAEGYMPDALLVKALHQSMGGYSFYNNPYVVYEVSTSSPFLLNGEYILSDSDTGYTYVGEYTEVYYSEIIEGDFKRRAGADTVSPFNLAKESIVVNKKDGTTATYTITKNCLLIVQSLESNETSAFNSTIPTVDENITLIELSKNVVGRGGYHSGVAVYQALVNGSGNVSLTKNRTALYIIL